MDRFAPVLHVPKPPRRAVVGVALLSAALVVAGCNVFGGIVPTPDTVDALVDDAETALTAGNTARAVRLYERAFEKDSTDVRVRVGLGNALYADRGLDVFALRRAAEHFVESAADPGASAAGQGAPASTVCTEGARPAASERYDVVSLDAESIRGLTEHASLVERVHRLVVAGVLEKTASGFASAEPDIRRTGFLVGSVTAAARRVVDVHRVFEAKGGTLFLDAESPSGRALIACGSTEADVRRQHGALCRLGDAARQGRQWLQARSQTDGEAQGSILTERLGALDDAIRARIDCS